MPNARSLKKLKSLNKKEQMMLELHIQNNYW